MCRHSAFQQPDVNDDLQDEQTHNVVYSGDRGALEHVVETVAHIEVAAGTSLPAAMDDDLVDEQSRHVANSGGHDTLEHACETVTHVEAAVDSSVLAASDDIAEIAFSESSPVETLADAFSCWFEDCILVLDLLS